ncbi:MAG TPA: hypothetical protein VFZ59_22390 [Verrucomicrobiae bacterium]|nr:hypothetical protein [Verrucomicrobiae bacterium]
MSRQATLSSENFTRFFDDNFGSDTWPQLKFLFNSKTLRAVEWISKGSVDEDAGLRAANHFYTPAVRGEQWAKGLTDPPLDGSPINSFEWVSEAYGAIHPNSESWKKARLYEFDGLTKSLKTVRDANLGHMFYALGHVIHLNQDLSQPSHTRDDNHFPVLGPSSPMENYGLKFYENAGKVGYQSAFPTSTRSWEQWRTAGFDKLEDFWDRKLYTGQPQALVANEAGSGLTQATLGLAEYSNGNFLSDDALYTEVKNLHFRHRFPFPSFGSGTDFRTVLQLPATAARPVLLKDGLPKNRLYFAKVKDGKTMTHHSAWSYLTAKKKETVKVSINDNNVLQEYHSILIPKAIEYSAGILDYFFRGKLEVTVGAGSAPGLVGLQIKNVSGDRFLGGAFRLFWDNAGGVRTELASPTFTTTYSSSLDDDQSITAEFPPQTGATDYVLIFQGTIGADGSTPHDSVDQNIAIAAQRLCCVPEAGDPVPNPFQLPDDTVIGQATIYEPPVSFGNAPPGWYHLEYVEGALDMWAFDDTAHYYYFTRFCYEPWCQHRIEVVSNFGAWLPGVKGAAFTEDLAAVEQATLALNPIREGNWNGGTIGLSLFDNFSIDPDEFTFHPPGATYRLRRVAKPIEVPDRVRIKDWETVVKPLVIVCNTCPGSSGVEWDGTFPTNDGFWDFPMWWNYDATAIKGKAIHEFWNPSVTYGYDSWYVSFYCGDSQLLWAGRKTVGSSPVGKYIQDLGSEPNQCATELECITLESY